MQILTIVIGIIFVLLLLSLLATTMMELLSSIFSLRSRNLVKALRNMLASSDPNEVLVDEFQRNSLYRHLTQQYGRSRSSSVGPSYMNAETFQSILFDVILKGDDMNNLEARLDALPDEDLRNVLKQLLRESGGQLDLFRLEVQNWYNSVMDRAAGWYKRYTQKILLLMGLGIAVTFNADTLSLYDRLSKDPETLELLTSAAERYVNTRERVDQLPQQVPAPAPINPTPTTTEPVAPNSTDPNSADPSFGDRAPADPFGTSKTVQPPITTGEEPAPATYLYSGEESASDKDFKTSLEELKGLLDNEIAEIRRPLGLGWEGVDLRELELVDLLSKFFGYILTALAVSLGAPFWFDLLKKLVNIRSSGARPYEE